MGNDKRGKEWKGIGVKEGEVIERERGEEKREEGEGKRIRKKGGRKKKKRRIREKRGSGDRGRM